ncbi:MAG: S8 family serine peptidase [Rudaea sp.]
MSNSRIEWLGGCCLLTCAALTGSAAAADVAPQVRAAMSASGSADALLVFADQSTPSLTPLQPGGNYLVHRRALVAALRARADTEQSATRAWLDAQGIAHRDFWIVNLIQARIPASALAALAARADVARIEPNPRIPQHLPQADHVMLPLATTGIASGVNRIHAPDVWAMGDTGQGVVIGGEDTGYQWDHPALKPHYRGWNGTSANHNFNWHDAIHDSTGNPCGNDSSAPCDDYGHGTHTMGTMTGDDGAGNQIGVAPGAKWIGCRNMDEGNGTPARYIECMQWMLAPTDSNGNNANSDLAPDIVNNSWTCPGAGSPSGPSEGCTPPEILETAVDNLVAGGIFFAAAAENNGTYGCASITDPPAIYDASFVVGATNSSDTLASFSSRGPVTGDNLIRPDVVAPGVNVYSSIPTNAYTTMSGTSMATPHVAGAAALLMSAFPALKGKPAEVASILRETAVRQGVTDPVTQSCGGIASTVWPNYALGYGRVDAFAAYSDVIFIDGFDD